MTTANTHETTDSFQMMPPLTPDEYDALRADIAANGVLVPVVVDQHGRILDGHHRYRIAADYGIDYPTETRYVASDDEAADVAVTLNAARRHLSTAQKQVLIGAELRRRPEDSDRAIARRVGCDHKTVGAVRRGGEIPQQKAPPASAGDRYLQAKRDALSELSRYGVLTITGFQIRPDLTFEEWDEVGMLLGLLCPPMDALEGSVR